MRQLFLTLSVCFLSSIASAQDYCSVRAQEAYNRVFSECAYGGQGGGCRYDQDCGYNERCSFGRCTQVGGGGGSSGCAYYTQHGVSACQDHGGCSWSVTSSQCYEVQGQPCSYYTYHGVSACQANSYCSWSVTSSQCYER